MMRLDAPAAKAELGLLKLVKVGDVRCSPLFPAIDMDIDWVCVSVAESEWVFDATFLGQPMFRMKIVELPETITLEVKDVI
jgi:hypothetical protein